MAQTAAQKKAAQDALKKAQALLAKQKATLTKLEDQAALANPAPARVNTTTLEGIQKASAVPAPATPADTYYTSKVGTTGLTQAQIDTRASASDVSKSINESYSGLGISSKFDPATGKVTTTKDDVVLTNTPPDNPLYVPPVVPKAKTPEELAEERLRMDAFAMLKDVFTSYGLEELIPVIEGYMRADIGTNQATLLLKQSEPYKIRFAGNEARRAKGLNVISEAAYLELENDYAETLRAYGLQDYFGVVTDVSSRKARQAKMAEVIGNNISAVEFKDRIDTAATRVMNSDADTRAAFKAFYNIGDTDLIKYFLSPAENADILKQKVTAAEISGAAMLAGLGGTSLMSATELAKLGIDKTEAQKGYATVAQVLPTATKLGEIYDEEGIKYTKATGEEEVFKGLASAKRKREMLVGRETAAFSGASGVNKASLNKSALGQI